MNAMASWYCQITLLGIQVAKSNRRFRRSGRLVAWFSFVETLVVSAAGGGVVLVVVAIVVRARASGGCNRSGSR